MKTLCKLLGGSHLYGLANKDSDIDHRGVFCNTEISKIIGLDRFDCENKQNNEVDSVLFEVRHYFNLLRKTNTQVLEILFAPRFCFLELDNKFEELVLNNREKFVDTKRFFKSLMGYMQGERLLVNGQRKGRMGKKRYEAIKRFGYSNKNFCNFIRLAMTGINFFDRNDYIVDCREFGYYVYNMLKQIRENPEKYDTEMVNRAMDNYENLLKKSFDNRDQSKDLTFDEEYSNNCLLEIYKEFLK